MVVSSFNFTPGVGVALQELRRLLRDVRVQLRDLFLARRLALESLDLRLDVGHLAVEALDVRGADAAGQKRQRAGEGARRARARPAGGGRPGTLLGGDEEVRAAVLLPAVFRLLGAEGALLAVGDGADPGRVDAERDQVLAGRVCAPVAEREVVLGRAAVVAVAFDQELRARVRLQPVGVGGESRAGVVAQVGLVVVEERVLQVSLLVQGGEVRGELVRLDRRRLREEAGRRGSRCRSELPSAWRLPS